jgi:hypothetical protein
MKKFVSLIIMAGVLAVPGIALTGAGTDEASPSNETSAKPARQCCQEKTVDEQRVFTASPQARCCSQGPAKAKVAAKAETCTGDSCNSAKRATGACAQWATDAAAVSNDKDQRQAGKAGQCQGKCGQGAATEPTSATASSDVQCKDCPEKDCKGKCAAVTTPVSGAKVGSAKVGGQSCKHCSKAGCKEECSDCAAARREGEAADSDETASASAPRGMGRGMGRGHGHAGDSQHAKDHQDFFFLLDHREAIRRTVKNLPDGVETLTESDEEDVAAMIQTHVEAMYDRMEHANPIRMRDPIFRAVFANANKIKMEVEHTDQGVRVRETSDDSYAVKLVQEHAKLVSLWLKNGYAELPKNHAAPQR